MLAYSALTQLTELILRQPSAGADDDALAPPNLRHRARRRIDAANRCTGASIRGAGVRDDRAIDGHRRRPPDADDDRRHDADTTVQGPGFAGDFGGLEVVEVAPPVTVNAGDRRRTTLVYILTSFRTGDVVIPPLTIALQGPGGADSLKTNQLSVSIKSVLGPNDTSLRPLKPQLDLGDDAPTPFVPAAVIAMFAALTVAGYALIRRAIALRPAPVPVPVPAAPPPPEVSAAEKARNQLDAIAAGGLATADPPEFYARIAAVVRWYVSERFGFPAYAMTRRELDQYMRSTETDRWMGRVAGNLLEQCDAAQFAGFIPAIERRDADLTAAYEIIAIADGAPAEL